MILPCDRQTGRLTGGRTGDSIRAVALYAVARNIINEDKSHAAARKPCDAACFCLYASPNDFRLLLFYIRYIKADLNVKP